MGQLRLRFGRQIRLFGHRLTQKSPLMRSRCSPCCSAGSAADAVASGRLSRVGLGVAGTGREAASGAVGGGSGVAHRSGRRGDFGSARGDAGGGAGTLGAGIGAGAASAAVRSSLREGKRILGGRWRWLRRLARLSRRRRRRRGRSGWLLVGAWGRHGGAASCADSSRSRAGGGAIGAAAGLGRAGATGLGAGIGDGAAGGAGMAAGAQVERWRLRGSRWCRWISASSAKVGAGEPRSAPAALGAGQAASEGGLRRASPGRSAAKAAAPPRCPAGATPAVDQMG